MAKDKQRRRDLEQESDEDMIVEVYANAINFTFGALDVSLDFGLRHPNDQPETKATVNKSLQHAWVRIKLMDRGIAQYRQQGGKFTLASEVFGVMGIPDCALCTSP